MTVQANVGDSLVIDGAGGHRECRIIRLQHPDGSPPYVVRWLSDGHLALFFPEPYTRLVRVEDPAGPRRGGHLARRCPVGRTVNGG